MYLPAGSLRAVSAFLFAVTFGPATAQVTFSEFPEGALVNGMSADGSVVVGVYDNGANILAIFRSTASGGLEIIGPNNSQSAPFISRDGKTIVAAMPDSNGSMHAAVWQGGTNWKLLTPFPGVVPSEQNVSSAPTGVSGDGSVIVGYAYVSTTKAVAFRWDAKNGMVNLATFDEGPNCDSMPYGVSGDGRTIVGWDFKPGFSPPGPGGIAMNQRRGAIWWDGRERLLHAFGWAGEAWATNDVGSIIVGQFHPMDQYNRAINGGASTYLYTAWDGHFEDLGAVPVPIGGDQRNYISQPFAVSDDGSVVVGESGWLEKLAMIWTRETGMMSMKDYLTQKGATEHLRWGRLIKAHYVSPDGRVVVGYGQKVGPSIRSWMATLR